MRNSISTIRILLPAVIILTMNGWAVAAQGAFPSEAQCSNALARARVEPKAVVREGILGGCGIDGTKQIARVIRGAGGDANPDLFPSLVQVSPRSGVIFEAALSLSMNASAVPTTRVGAMRILAAQLVGEGGDLRVAGGVSALAKGAGGCLLALDGSGDTTGVVGDPLPTDYRTRVRTSMEAIALNSANHAIVRNAARCMRAHFKPALIEPLDASTIEIANICETQFRIRNTGPRSVILTFDVVSKPGRTNFRSPVGESLIVAQHPGLVRLYYSERQIGSARSSKRACPARP